MDATGRPGMRKKGCFRRDKLTRKNALSTRDERQRELVPSKVLYCTSWAMISAQIRDKNVNYGFF